MEMKAASQAKLRQPAASLSSLEASTSTEQHAKEGLQIDAVRVKLVGLLVHSCPFHLRNSRYMAVNCMSSIHGKV